MGSHLILPTAPRVTYSSDSSLAQRTCSLEEEPQAKGKVLVSSGAAPGARPPNSLLPHFADAGPSGRKMPPGGGSSLNLRLPPAALSPSPRASVPHTACCKRFTAWRVGYILGQFYHKRFFFNWLTVWCRVSMDPVLPPLHYINLRPPNVLYRGSGSGTTFPTDAQRLSVDNVTHAGANSTGAVTTRCRAQLQTNTHLSTWKLMQLLTKEEILVKKGKV